MIDSNARSFLGTALLSILVIAGGVSAQSASDRGKARPPADTEKTADILSEIADIVAEEAMAHHGLPDPVTDEDFQPRDEKKEALGRLLFFDKILSGNRNISCATCHHPMAVTGDGLSLSVGEGARGLGVTRNTGTGDDAVMERVPRNAPHIFNLGAIEYTRMFHDGRVEEVAPGVFVNPAGEDLPDGLDNALAAQAMFPVTSATEMAGQDGENPIASAAAAGNLAGPGGVWRRLANRLRNNAEYASMFVAAFDDVYGPGDITFVHAANAIAAYEAAAFRADDSPFDRWLRGDRKALSRHAKKGMQLFYGSARCAECHSGTFQTSHEFVATAMPQIGPGKGDSQDGYDDGHDDFGRERVTGDPEDRFRFRVPSLRNVAITGPWGHDGAYNTLEGIVRHQLDPVAALHGYDTAQAVLPPRPDLDAKDFIVHNDAARRAAIDAACELEPRNMSEKKVQALIAFLRALTDPRSLDMRSEVPMSVPSGLRIFD